MRSREKCFHCLSQVLQNVPAITDLDGQRSTLRGSISIDASPIPADDVNAFVRF
jgi:hypothetical protein